MTGAICRVVLRGEVACVDGQVLVLPGYGMDLRELQPTQPKNVSLDINLSIFVNILKLIGWTVFRMWWVFFRRKPSTLKGAHCKINWYPI